MQNNMDEFHKMLKKMHSVLLHLYEIQNQKLRNQFISYSQAIQKAYSDWKVHKKGSNNCSRKKDKNNIHGNANPKRKRDFFKEARKSAET